MNDMRFDVEATPSLAQPIIKPSNYTYKTNPGLVRDLQLVDDDDYIQPAATNHLPVAPKQPSSCYSIRERREPSRYQDACPANQDYMRH